MGEPPFHIMTGYSNPIMVSKGQNNSFIIETQYKYSLSPVLNMPFSNLIHSSIVFSKSDFPKNAVVLFYIIPYETSGKEYGMDLFKTALMDKNFLGGNGCIVGKEE